MLTLTERTDDPYAVRLQGFLAICRVSTAISPYSSRCDISYSSVLPLK
jgi:hypothetical protein